jgi:hypothetical protein
MTRHEGPSRSAPRPSPVRWLLALVPVAFLLGLWLGRDRSEPQPALTPASTVEIRIDMSDLTLLPDASLRFDMEPKQIDEFRAPSEDSPTDNEVDNDPRKR